MDDLRLADDPTTKPMRQAIRGELVVPDDPAYDQARRVWNGMIDKRPLAVIYCADSDDVITAVNFARSQNLLVAVRAGGHNVAGSSVCNAGVVIDVSRMKRIEVDPVRRVARAQAGLNLGEFDAATQAHGLATTMGVNADTGIAGLTLGGVVREARPQTWSDVRQSGGGRNRDRGRSIVASKRDRECGPVLGITRRRR
jgi:FAD/FMN-containing dehydrogenase